MAATLPTPELVMFDVDYTLLRPNQMFEAEGYHSVGRRFGLELDPSRWREAERAAYAAVRERRLRLGVVHDPGVYDAIAIAVVGALGGDDPQAVAATAATMVAEWERCDNFDLYDDVLPCLRRLRDAGLRIALVSNTDRDLDVIITHFRLGDYVDVAVSSAGIGFVKPAAVIFKAVLRGLRVDAGRAVMVGDSLEDDVRGAEGCGCTGVLLDRDGRHDVDVPCLRTLAELPALLSL